ncbi:hypothetical protein POM88_043558 [Heracleum sosnowskyi]|uniref:chorismate mutase n=1 Tax=Heracleum sosnowskyi TaxID=360622 RepID=A0AAD8H3K8_9APIA|nr:hypothetical protein POM88_043558 [Heracleum sosnowskyi]
MQASYSNLPDTTFKVGRYGSPEEHPFFPDNLSSSVLPQYNHSQILHPTTAAININETIWDVYVNQLLPLFTTEGDDGNYVPTATSDLQCLQLQSYEKPRYPLRIVHDLRQTFSTLHSSDALWLKIWLLFLVLYHPPN